METSTTLLKRLAGSPTAADWQRLFELYQPLLRSWLARARVPKTDAEDIMQEVLLVVFRLVGDFKRRGRGAFRAWLWTILAHRIRDYFRGLKRRPAAIGSNEFLRALDKLESPDCPLTRLWDREHDEHVAGLLMRRVESDFTPATWQAFQRQVLDGAPAKLVASELGLSLNSVLLAKSRVLKRMRQEMAGLVVV